MSIDFTAPTPRHDILLSKFNVASIVGHNLLDELPRIASLYKDKCKGQIVIDIEQVTSSVYGHSPDVTYVVRVRDTETEEQSRARVTKQRLLEKQKRFEVYKELKQEFENGNSID
jgi:hypothetical protein